MKPNQVLPELVMASLSISLWFTPKELLISGVDISRLLKASGLATSTVLYAKSYLMLVCNWNRFESDEQKEEIQETIELELFEYEQASHLAIKKMEIDKRVLQASVPLANEMAAIEERQHPELSEEQKQQAARNAIESALTAPTVIEVPETVVSEEMFRKLFPEEMDNTSWKAILKAMQSGCEKEQIIKDVLGCNDANKAVGMAYLEFLKTRFMG